MLPRLLTSALCVLFASVALAAPPKDHVVVMISVDGLAHFYFDDPKAEMPNIRALAKEGARAEKMQAVLPTVTWPNHTTLVTGVSPAKHGVVGNSFFDREKKAVMPVIWEPLFNKDEIVKVPTVYDLAHQAGLKTASIVWPGTRGASTLDLTMPCVNKLDLFKRYGTASLFEEFTKAGIPWETEEEGFKGANGPARDRMHVQMLNHILRTHRPQLALLHLLEVDHVEHAKGPQSPEAYAAVKEADACVGEVWAELKKSFPGKATLIVVSDHGFFRYRQLVQPNAVLRAAGLLQAEGHKISSATPVRALSQGGASFVYILDEKRREELLPKVAELFRQQEGVALVVTPAEFEQYGLGDPAKLAIAPDLVLSAKEGYMFGDGMAGGLAVTPPAPEEKGSHGYNPNEPRLHASFVAWGHSIKPGAKLPTIKNRDVAPTIARILGFPMPDVEGQVLEAALKTP